MLFLLEEVELKPTEMAIYNYINANLDKVIYMRIRELADATYVSTTTILRFCKKFGCQGYADFKSQLYHYAKIIPSFNLLTKQSSQNFYKEQRNQIFKENLGKLLILFYNQNCYSLLE